MDNKYKQQPDYDLLVQQVKALGEEENYWLPVLANTSALLMNALPDLNWAGFYLMNRDSLVLGPFQGNPACIRIPLCAGVCGAAALQNKVQRVVDALRLKTSDWLLFAVSAAVTLMFGIWITLNPEMAWISVWTFTGIALIVEGALDLAVVIMQSRTAKE